MLGKLDLHMLKNEISSLSTLYAKISFSRLKDLNMTLETVKLLRLKRNPWNYKNYKSTERKQKIKVFNFALVHNCLDMTLKPREQKQKFKN